MIHLSQLLSDRFVIVFSLALFNPYLIFQIAIIIALFIYSLFFSECILPGSVFWGLWTRKDNSLNYYRAFIKRITASHITFHLQTNNAPTYPIEQNRTKNNRTQSNSNRSIGLGNRTKSNTYFAVSSIFEPIEPI